MESISLYEVEQNFYDYVKRIEIGEIFIVTRDNMPLFEMRPLKRKMQKLRPFGLCKGEFEVPDDFDAPLPDDIVDEFEGISKV